MEAKKFLLVTKKEAEAQGLARYFTGVLCKRGHVAERRTSSSDCVECSKERQQTSSVRQYKQSQYAKDKEKILMRAKNRYQQNKQPRIAYAAEYQRKHSKKIYQRQKVALQQKLQDSPWLTIHFRLRAGISGALMRVGASKKNSRTMSIVSCTTEEFKAHIEKQFLPNMTWHNRDQWHIDHITPISKAQCEQDVIALYHFTNLRPLWAADNIRKSNKEMFLI